MRCDKCGFENQEGALFCSKCGAPLFRKCIKCGSEIKLDEDFCSKCGADNRDKTIENTAKKKTKKRKTRKVILLILFSILGVFMILQGISIVKALNHFKSIEPLTIMYCDGVDERTGMLHYTPALMYAVIDGFDYTICIKNLSGSQYPSKVVAEMVRKAVDSGTSEFFYSTVDENLLYQDLIKDNDVREYIYRYSVYEDKIKFIRFGWFWDQENGSITLKSGHKLLWYWEQPFPFRFNNSGKVIINGKESAL